MLPRPSLMQPAYFSQGPGARASAQPSVLLHLRGSGVWPWPPGTHEPLETSYRPGRQQEGFQLQELRGRRDPLAVNRKVYGFSHVRHSAQPPSCRSWGQIGGRGLRYNYRYKFVLVSPKISRRGICSEATNPQMDVQSNPRFQKSYSRQSSWPPNG